MVVLLSRFRCSPPSPLPRSSLSLDMFGLGSSFRRDFFAKKRSNRSWLCMILVCIRRGIVAIMCVSICSRTIGSKSLDSACCDFPPTVEGFRTVENSVNKSMTVLNALSRSGSNADREAATSERTAAKLSRRLARSVRKPALLVSRWRTVLRAEMELRRDRIFHMK